MEIRYNNKLPYRFKYLEEYPLFSRWFIFGGSNGMVDINDGTGDVFETIPEDYAKKIIKIRDKFLDELSDINDEIAEKYDQINN